jgi:hypothetical protein
MPFDFSLLVDNATNGANKMSDEYRERWDSEGERKVRELLASGLLAGSKRTSAETWIAGEEAQRLLSEHDARLLAVEISKQAIVATADANRSARRALWISVAAILAPIAIEIVKWLAR